MQKLPPILATILILLMVVLAIISLRQESAIMDEVAHIPAGYSYLTQKDMRLNPEHPPLLKDLSAIPLLFINARLDSQDGVDARRGINFPSELSSWKDEVNSQWDFGFNFLYNSNNDADKIIFWSRLPMLLLLIAMGFFIYRWTKELYGKWSALLATFLFAFAPTFIAHGRYVTTDVGAAFGFFISIYYFVKYIKQPNAKNLILAGIFFGVAQLIKFSLFLLVPYFGLLILLLVYALHHTSKKDRQKQEISNYGEGQAKWRGGEKFFKNFFKYIGKFILIMIIGYILVYPVYVFHTTGYPYEKQISDTEYHASHFPLKPARDAVVWMVHKPILRPYAQYFLGLAMVFQRATGGNTTFFLGEVTNKGWKTYFPIVYAIKTPLALHILTIIALLFLAWQCKKPFWKGLFTRTVQSFRDNFSQWAMLIFLAVFWAASLSSNLNIGVRHILPTFPFVYILVSGQIKKIYTYIKAKKTLIPIYYLLIAILLGWYVYSSITIFPFYLTHFNELVGGAKNGHKYVTDSNLDWGQDLKRLAKWVDEQGLDKIKVDYFGGATVEYYLGDKYERYHASYGYEAAKGNWLAVSATFKQQGQAIPTKGWDKPTDEYMWLLQYEPVTVVGNSIFVYYID